MAVDRGWLGTRLRAASAALGRHRWYTSGALVLLVAAGITAYQLS